MTEITNKDIKKIAKLARIEIDEENCRVFCEKIESVVSFFETLNEVDTQNVEPMINVHHAALRLAKDEIKDGGIEENILKNAKISKYGYFAVPKVIE